MSIDIGDHVGILRAVRAIGRYLRVGDDGDCVDVEGIHDRENRIADHRTRMRAAKVVTGTPQRMECGQPCCIRGVGKVVKFTVFVYHTRNTCVGLDGVGTDGCWFPRARKYL
jgi:hypothetical protein